jgi:hypothetical protein
MFNKLLQRNLKRNLCILLFCITSLLLSAPCTAQTTFKDSLLNDCDTFFKLLKTHPNLNWKDQKAELKIKSQIQLLKNQIQSGNKLNSDSLLVYQTKLLQAIAHIRDGHSGFVSLDKTFGTLPIYIAPFSDGYYIIATSKEYQDLLGGRLIRIGSYDLKETLQKLKTISNSSNLQGFNKNLAQYLNKPGLLYGLGISKTPDSTYFLIELNGKQNGIYVTSTIQSPGLITYLGQNNIPLPFYLQNRDQNYWYHVLPDSSSLYVALNSIENMSKISFPVFVKQLDTIIRASNIQRLIIDIRLNGGGDNFLNVYLLKLIQDHPQLNQKDRLFLITGFRTFSAAINLYADLENFTGATMIGEPVGDMINFPGDAKHFQLPAFNISMRISQLMWINTFDWDRREKSRIDIPAQISFSSYAKGEDPALSSIFQIPLKNIRDIGPFQSSLKDGNYQLENEILKITTKNGQQNFVIPGKMEGKLLYKKEHLYITSNPYVYILNGPTPSVQFRYNEKDYKKISLKKINVDTLHMKVLDDSQISHHQWDGNNLSLRALRVFILHNDKQGAKELLDFAILINRRAEMAKKLRQRLE